MNSKNAEQHPLNAYVPPHLNPTSLEIPSVWDDDTLKRFAALDRTLASTPAGSKLDSYCKFQVRYRDPRRQFLADLEFESARRQKCLGYLEYLKTEAEQGFINGLRELALIAHQATSALTRLAESHPNYVAYVARTYPSWPILETVSSGTKKAKEFLVSILLDQEQELLVQRPRGNMESPARKWAGKLLRCIEYYRRVQNVGKPASSGPAQQPREIAWAWRHLSSDRGEMELKESHLPEILRLCQELPPLTEDSFKSWWKAAARILRLATNDRPWEVRELESYANTTRVNVGFSDRKSDGVRRDAILEQIRKAAKRLIPQTVFPRKSEKRGKRLQRKQGKLDRKFSQ